MTDAAAFLAALAADPSDRTLRLAYADFLEERGDAGRAEYVRAGERMRELPPFADAYWELKSRRDALRPALPAGWPTATGPDDDFIFRAGVPDDWKGRWRLVRLFAERWRTTPVPAEPPDVAGAERRLGRKLPPGLKEWLAVAPAVAGFDYESGGGRDYVVVGLTDVPALRATSLGSVAGAPQWFVRDEDWWGDDPPVYREFDLAGRAGRREGARPFALSSSELALALAVGTASGHQMTQLLRTRPRREVLEEFGRRYPVRATWGHQRLFEERGAFALASPANADGSLVAVTELRR